MILQDNPLQLVLPLQHMAKVKTVEVLWRNSVKRHEFNYLYVNSQFEFSHYQPMSEYLVKDVDKLLIPEVIKDELKIFVTEMVYHAISWVFKTTKKPKESDPLEHNDVAIFSYFIDNFSWENSGCVDGRGMIHSYVKNKETVDFNTWRLLCDYCIEDDIIRFSEAIDWKNCKNFMCSFTHCLYWYRKIYGEFPTKEMFSSDEEYSKFERAQYDESKIIKKMLDKSLNAYGFPAGITAIRYFQNQRKYEVELEEIFLGENILDSPHGTVVYILEQREENKARLEHICTSRVLFNFLVRWPWNMFTDNWMDILNDKSVSPLYFLDIFRTMSLRMRAWRRHKLTEEQYKLLCNRIVYQFFKELWTIFKREFGVDNNSTRKALMTVYRSNDIIFCKILFDQVESSQRIYFLRILEGFWAQQLVRIGPIDSDFCTEFLREVLKSDEEREIFREIVSNCLENDRRQGLLFRIWNILSQ